MSCPAALKPWARIFALHCSSSLSCINELLDIDSGGCVYELPSRINCSIWLDAPREGLRQRCLSSTFEYSTSVVSASGREYCRGYQDEHGQWNNGFFCPRWGPRDRDYCCGTDRHRYCCPPTTDVRQTRNTDGHK